MEFMRVVIKIPTIDYACNECKFNQITTYCSYFQKDLALSIANLEGKRCKECFDLQTKREKMYEKKQQLKHNNGSQKRRNIREIS